MAPLALALHLLLAAPGPTGLAPPPDPGPFGGGELAAASLGVLLGDVLVVGAGYGALRLFADGALEPTASNFRHAAYVLGATALVVPPLTAVLLARWTERVRGSGSTWKGLILATAGHTLSVAAGLLAAPDLWLMVPVQLVLVAVGTTVGLHWGPRGSAPRARGLSPAAVGETTDPAPPAAAPVARLGPPRCPA